MIYLSHFARNRFPVDDISLVNYKNPTHSTSFLVLVSTMSIKSITDGVYTPIVTFYKADGYTIDTETQINHAKYLQQNGIKGLVVFGTTGENPLLTQLEKLQLVSRIHQDIPDMEIVVGISESNIQNAIQSIKEFQQVGASMAMVLPSFYYGNDTPQQGIVDWYTEVADSSVLPMILYIFPGVSNGLQVLPETVRILSSHKNIIGCKCSHGDVHQYSRIALDPQIEANNFKLLSGQGQLLLPLLSINGKGVIDALSGCFPKTFVKLYDSVTTGDMETAKRLQFVAAEAEVLASQGGFLAIKRAIKEHLGLGECISGRKPMNFSFSDEEWGGFESVYNMIKATEDSIE